MNKFKRPVSDKSQKENSLPDSIKSGSLPKTIFGNKDYNKPAEEDNNRGAYKDRLRQLNGNKSAENLGRRQPSNNSNRRPN